MEQKIEWKDIKLSPLRSLDDFLLESARFQIPKDVNKWNNRVLKNLLYYQTNYILMSCVIFLLVSVIHPTKMLSGTIALAVAFSLFFYFTNDRPSVTQFKKDHPISNILLILGGGYFTVHMLGSIVTVCVFGTMLPILVTLVHASLRLRNIRNKIANKIDKATLRSTPMGMLLKSMNQNLECNTDITESNNTK